MSEEIQLPDSFDEFVERADQQEELTAKERNVKLHEKFQQQRNNWSGKVREMSRKLRRVGELAELMETIYTDRQEATEYKHYLSVLLIKINKKYRGEFAAKYKHYSWGSQYRFPNEKTKQNQILSEMENLYEMKEAISNHVKFMENTVQTIDNVIFGIKYRLDVERISIGNQGGT